MIESLLETLFPQRCGICGLTGVGALCEDCNDLLALREAPCEQLSGEDGPDSISAPVFYRAYGGVCVRRLKFDRRTQLAQPMAELMSRYAWSEQLSHADALVPVPLHWLRKSARGFNQSLLLSSHLSESRGIPIRQELLSRVRYTRPQSRMSPSRRLVSLRDAFQATGCEGLHLVLVDDVYGTGQTVIECARALKSAGARRVDALVFARA